MQFQGLVLFVQLWILVKVRQFRRSLFYSQSSCNGWMEDGMEFQRELLMFV